MNTVEGWHRVDFGSLLALIRNGYSGQQVGRITEFPVSRIETISDGVVDLLKVGFVDSIPDSYLLNVGDILFSNINSLKHIGKAAQVKAGTYLFHGMNLLVFRAVDDVDAQFLFYKLTGAKPWFEKMATQAINQASINQTTIKELVLDIPTSKAEQTKIAEVLSTVDRVIEQTEALIAKQQRIKTGLMQDLLTRGIDEHGNLRSEQTHKFEDSPLGRIPVEWKVKPLGEVIASITDYRGMTPPYTNEGIAAISAENIGGGKVKSITKWVSPATYKRTTTRGFPEAGDTIFTTEAPVAEVARLPGDQIYRLTRRLIALCPKPTVRKGFLYCSMFHLSVIGAWESKMHGSTVPRILKPDILAQPFAIPSVAEQDIITSSLDTQEKRLEDEAAHLVKLRSLKTALMQDLLTGKVPVTPLLIEPQEAGV